MPMAIPVPSEEGKHKPSACGGKRRGVPNSWTFLWCARGPTGQPQADVAVLLVPPGLPVPLLLL